MFGIETLYEVLFVHVCLVSLAVEEAPGRTGIPMLEPGLIRHK